MGDLIEIGNGQFREMKIDKNAFITTKLVQIMAKFNSFPNIKTPHSVRINLTQVIWPEVSR